MKVKLISSIAWEGQHKEAGTALDVSDADGYWLISRGRATAYTEANQIDSDKRADSGAATTRAPKKKAAKK
jgi:hypothetical protein